MPIATDVSRSLSDLLTSLRQTAGLADEAGQPAAEALAAWRASRLPGLVIPEEYGGLGLDALALNRVVADLARADASIAIITFQHFAVSARIVEWGSQAQKEAYLPDAAHGRLLFASAWSETGAGADKRRLSTQATVQRDGHWLVNGEKSFTTGAGLADLYLVLAQSAEAATPSDSTYGGAGQTFFLIEATNPGLVAEAGIDLVGMRGSATGSIRLDRCRVPDSAVLGPVGEAARIIATVRESGASLGAVSVGIAEAAYQLLVNQLAAQNRIDAPATRYALVDLATQVEAARAIVERAGRRDGAQPGATTLHSKLFASVTAEAITAAVGRLLGGSSFLRRHAINRLFRDARAVALMGPTNELCRELLRSHA